MFNTTSIRTPTVKTAYSNLDTLRQVDSFEGARKAEAELLPLLEVYSERQFTEPHVPETLHPFSKELRNLTSMMSNRLSG